GGSLVRPSAPECERSPPRSEGDLSSTEVRLASSDSPSWARVLFTVRAAISSASSSEEPLSSWLSLMCSYWRSRFLLHASGMTPPALVVHSPARCVPIVVPGPVAAGGGGP